MSKFNLNLSFKDIKVLKHSLEIRIKDEANTYSSILNKSCSLNKSEEIFLKEHQEHVKCLEHLVEEIKRVGNKVNENVFGDKYE